MKIGKGSEKIILIIMERIMEDLTINHLRWVMRNDEGALIKENLGMVGQGNVDIAHLYHRGDLVV
jgi:hypothetical protein